MTGDVDQVLGFWLDDVGSDNWLKPDAKAEAASHKFKVLWAQASAGKLNCWICDPRSCLALIILLDQMPRLMFGEDRAAYGSDSAALAVAKRAIVMGHDLKTDEPQRQLFYSPLMHSESLMDQERSVRLIALRLPQAQQGLLAHSRAHRDIIRQFGRFPQRNALMGRRNTEAEAAYLSQGGYAETMRTMQVA